MFAYLRRRYLEGSISEKALDNAVDVFSWITRQQATVIKAEKTRLENAAEPPAVEAPKEEPKTED